MERLVATRLSRGSSPADVESDLALLWRDAGRDGPVARALMANLIVYRDRPATEEVDLSAAIEGLPIDEVAQRHPSRVILLLHGGKPDLSGPVGAAITIVLFGPPQARMGVEQIAIRSACAEASLPSIVRRLVLGDVPTSIWWAEDFSCTRPLDGLITMGRQLVYDSKRWRDLRGGVLALAAVLRGPHPPDFADLNWRRLTPMRQALTQALSPPLGPAVDGPLRLHVRHRPGDGALAWLLAGWFGSRLGSTAEGDGPTIEEERRGDEILAVSLETKSGSALTATMTGHRVLVKYARGGAPLSVSVPHESDADAVAAELCSLRLDLALRETIATLARRFTSSTAP
jgi:hypothetical protein